MSNLTKPPGANWSVCWIYTREEWNHFQKWRSRQKGFLHYLWYFLFHKKSYVSSSEFSQQWVKIGTKTKYFNGPVTELKRVDISDEGAVNVMKITYENISKNQLDEINILIPQGRLREAIEAREKLNEVLVR